MTLFKGINYNIISLLCMFLYIGITAGAQGQTLSSLYSRKNSISGIWCLKNVSESFGFYVPLSLCLNKSISYTGTKSVFNHFLNVPNVPVI